MLETKHWVEPVLQMLSGRKQYMYTSTDLLPMLFIRILIQFMELALIYLQVLKCYTGYHSDYYTRLRSLFHAGRPDTVATLGYSENLKRNNLNKFLSLSVEWIAVFQDSGPFSASLVRVEEQLVEKPSWDSLIQKRKEVTETIRYTLDCIFHVCQTHFMEQSSTWGNDVCFPGKDVSHLYETSSFVTVFTKFRH
jgi:hypothetical protein